MTQREVCHHFGFCLRKDTDDMGLQIFNAFVLRALSLLILDFGMVVRDNPPLLRRIRFPGSRSIAALCRGFGLRSLLFLQSVHRCERS